MTETTAGKIYRWTELPSIELFDGLMIRRGFRSDGALLTFNWIKPGLPRWRPHSHPFDQIVLTVQGRQMLEVEGELMECGPGTAVRVPAGAEHTGWPGGDEEVLNIDVFAPPREDYLFLVEWQKEYPQPAGGFPAYHQHKTSEPFTGRMKEDTTDVLYRWRDLPTTEVMKGMRRAGFRGDHALLSFNRISPGTERAEPHSHPFDQLVLTMEGRMVLEIDGRELVCEAGTIVRVPPDAPHTGWPIGDQPVLNLDIFAPPREDYLFLVDYQKDYAPRAAG